MPSQHAHPTECLIGLGANLGDRQRALDDAIASLSNHARLTVASVSPWVGTPAIGGPDNQGEFLNGAALLQTTLSPRQLLAVMHEVESLGGRKRSQRWAPRRLDLDLLLYGSYVEQKQPTAMVPHPWMAIRPFVLRPALDVAPNMVHPQLDMTISELWQLASRQTTIVVVLQSGSTDRPAVEQAKSVLRRCAQQAGARLVALPRNVDVGLSLDGRIQSMAESAEFVAGAIRDAGRGSLIVHGWWDYTMLENEIKGKLPTKLIEKRLELASMIPLPNVTIGLLPPPREANRRDSAAHNLTGFETSFDDYLARRPAQQRSPFLKIREDVSQIAHDLRAILSGFAETDRRPAG